MALKPIRNVGLWLLCLATLVAGCSSGDDDGDDAADDGMAGATASAACLPGEQLSCPCTGGASGIKICNGTGTAYSTCQCPMAAIGGATGGSPATTGTSGQSGASGSGGVPSVTGSGGSGGQPTETGGAGGATDMTPPAVPLATGIRIAEVALYQPVKISLAKAGEPVVERNAPVVLDKQALIRVSLEPLDGWTARDIVVELTLSSSEGPAESQKTTRRVTGASSDAMLDSTVNFDIPAEAMTSDLRYAVALREVEGATPSGTADPAARFPKTEGELATLSPREAGPLRVMFVPYRYTPDGSNRLPVTDDAQMELFRDTLYTYYPVSDIQIQMHEPVDYDSAVGPNTGWEQWLDFHCALREDEHPDPKLMYYGAMSMRASLQAYGGGIIGISYVPTAAGNYGRCSVGIGWEGDLSATTMAHELGHALGLPHAPCGVDGGPYPYEDALIGVWGYSFKEKQLRDPSEYHDMMSYCDPSFISDYNFEKLFERIRYLNLQFDVTPRIASDYVRILSAQGRLSFSGRTRMQDAPGSDDQRHAVTLIDAQGGEESADAYFVPMSQSGSGSWFVPDTGASAVRIDGATVVLR
jgi:hypothetical protein